MDSRVSGSGEDFENEQFLAVKILQSELQGSRMRLPSCGRISQEITQDTLGLHKSAKTVAPRKKLEGREQIRMLVERRGKSLTKKESWRPED